MIHYILQIIVFQALFLAVYELFLKNETFFNLNRAYLLITFLISFALPFSSMTLFQSLSPEGAVIVLPEVIIGQAGVSQPLNAELALKAGIVIEEAQTPIWQWLLLAGSLIVLLVFAIKLMRLYVLLHNNPKHWQNNVLIVSLLNEKSAFSFFNYIFLGTEISEDYSKTILNHEMIHVKEKHSLDILLLEILKIGLWFNPCIYIYQNRLKTVHEFIADNRVIDSEGSKSFYKSLLHQVFEVKSLSFANTFYNKSLIKKRIAMLQKSKSTKKAYWKLLMVLPALLVILSYVSCEKEAALEDINQTENLDQFSYTMNVGEYDMSPEVKTIHENYEEFLRSNPDYVSWAIIDKDQKSISYSVHHKDEKPDFKYMELEPTDSDDRSYKMYLSLMNSSDALVVTEKEEINPDDYNGKSEVPFSIIDVVPTFEECSDLNNDEAKKCTSQAIAKFVNRNFDVDLATSLGLSGRQRISVYFEIGVDGKVTEIKARAPHPGLEEEAKRVISLLPQMSPGLHDGEAVTVPYSLPILFQIAE